MSPVTERSEVSGWDRIMQTFEKLGFGRQDFGPEFMEKYAGFHWLLMPHPVAVQRFYAIPPQAELLSKPWESWYFINGKAQHHVHYARQYDGRWEPWIQPEPAPECPEELVGIQWFWYNEDRVTPSMLIKE